MTRQVQCYSGKKMTIMMIHPLPCSPYNNLRVHWGLVCCAVSCIILLNYISTTTTTLIIITTTTTTTTTTITMNACLI